MKLYMIIGIVLATVLVAAMMVFDGDVKDFVERIYEELLAELDPFAVCIAVIAVIIGIGAVWLPYLLWVILYVIKAEIESKKEEESE